MGSFLLAVHTAVFMVVALTAAAGLPGLAQSIADRVLVGEQKQQRMSEDLAEIRGMRLPEQLATIRTELAQARAEIQELKTAASGQSSMQVVNLVGLLGLGTGQVLVVRRRKMAGGEGGREERG